MTDQNDGKSWFRWERDEKEYGEVMYRRAIGELPEMESSKAAAKILREHVRPGDAVLDVGAGPGHYLRSYRAAINVPFEYTGLDATPSYVALARKAFSNDPHAQFREGDIFNLSYPDQSFDIVTCNNVLLHLPNIIKPMAELLRVARRAVLIRSLVGTRSFAVREVYPAEPAEFDDAGEPRKFFFYNIYSETYVRYLAGKNPRAKEVAVALDADFDPAAIEAGADVQKEKLGVTRMVGGLQTNGYLILPWSFVRINLL